MKEDIPNTGKLPKWLEEQQHNSWQIEILIASGIIFFLLKIPEHITSYFLQTAASTAINSSIIIIMVGGYIFSRALLIGFVVNLILRAVWLAMLGINGLCQGALHLIVLQPQFLQIFQLSQF